MKSAYRITSTLPLPRNLIEAAFGAFIRKRTKEHSNQEVWQLYDGSKMILSQISEKGVYLELNYVFSDGFKVLNTFYSFCIDNGSKVKSERTGSIVPSSGALFSDYKDSKAFKEYMHAKNNPKDSR
jgi:hypothetical protein